MGRVSNGMLLGYRRVSHPWDNLSRSADFKVATTEQGVFFRRDVGTLVGQGTCFLREGGGPSPG